MNLNEYLSPLAAPPTKQFWALLPLDAAFSRPLGRSLFCQYNTGAMHGSGSKQLSMNVLYYIFFGHMAKKENAFVYKSR